MLKHVPYWTDLALNGIYVQEAKKTGWLEIHKKKSHLFSMFHWLKGMSEKYKKRFKGCL